MASPPSTRSCAKRWPSISRNRGRETPIATPSPRTAAIPKRLADFELLEMLGQGGMGTVFRARQTSLDRIVAVKILPPSLARNEQFILLNEHGQPKLADLGMAKPLTGGDASLTQSGTVLGTPYYMAPEQYKRVLSVQEIHALYSPPAP